MFFNRSGGKWRSSALGRLQSALSTLSSRFSSQQPQAHDNDKGGARIPLHQANGPQMFITNEDAMSYWKMVSGGLRIGTRRPTEYPVWATLEVAKGGFATGYPLAGVPSSEGSYIFMLAGGLKVLQEMLVTGKYYIRHPENAALLVYAWLLQKGRLDEASALYEELAPYMYKMRFHPYPTNEVPDIDTTSASVATVDDLREDLEELIEKARDAKGHRYDQIRRQGAVVDGYAELQADAIVLLLSTVPDSKTFLEGQGGDGLFARPMDSQLRDSIIERSEKIQKEKGEVPGHQKKGTTTYMMLEAIRSPETAKASAVSARIRGVAKARGIKGSDQFVQYMSALKKSAIPEQFIEGKAKVVASRVSSFDKGARLGRQQEETILAPITDTEAANIIPKDRRTMPESICRIVRRPVVAPLSVLIEKKVINSAEMIANVLPQMLSGAVAECIEDPVARRIYALLAIAFARRRSLLLLNFESQVKLEELPWGKPLVKLIEGNPNASRECERVVKDAVQCYFKYFPSTITPNKLVRALKDAMHVGAATKTCLMEELAADIFQTGFSPNFEAAAAISQRMMQNTVYSRYYGLGLVFKSPEMTLHEQAKKKMSDWQHPIPTNQWTTTAINGRTIEAAMVITTHNLAQLVDKCNDMPDFDFAAAVIKVWDRIIKLFLTVPMQPYISWQVRLHAQRDVAYMWRQLLFFITRVGANAGGDVAGEGSQRAVLADMRAVAARRTKSTPDVFEKLNNHFLNPLETVIGGKTHVIEGKVKEGAIVLGYYGWHCLKSKAFGPQLHHSGRWSEEEKDKESETSF